MFLLTSNLVGIQYKEVKCKPSYTEISEYNNKNL